MSRRSAALIALLLCFACLRDEKPAQTTRASRKAPTAPATGDGAPQEGGTLVRRLESDVTTLNPHINAASYDRNVEDYLFTPIVYLDQDLQAIPGLADSWEILEGGKLYRFELNDKATFADGTPVKAAESGTVAYAGNEVKGYGNLVLIRHDNGLVSAYAHNGEISVKRGDKVKRGQVVAKSGQSGNVTSPQLHFEIRKGSTPVDPVPHLGGT